MLRGVPVCFQTFAGTELNRVAGFLLIWFTPPPQQLPALELTTPDLNNTLLIEITALRLLSQTATAI